MMKIALSLEFQSVGELQDMLDGPLGKLLKDNPISLSEAKGAACDAWLDEHGKTFYEVLYDERVSAIWNIENLIKILCHAQEKNSKSVTTRQIREELGLQPSEIKQAMRVLRLAGNSLVKNPRGATPIKEACGTEWMFDWSRYEKGHIYKLRAATIRWIDTYLGKAKES